MDRDGVVVVVLSHEKKEGLLSTGLGNTERHKRGRKRHETVKAHAIEIGGLLSARKMLAKENTVCCKL